MDDPDPALPEPSNLRFLRLLVTGLTAVMICGVLLIVTLLVIRLNTAPAALPDAITLPSGVSAEAFTVTEHWYGVVVDGGQQILIFDRRDDRLLQTIEVLSPE